MKITRSKLPDNSILSNDHKKYDYADSFKGILTDSENKVKPADIGKAFFSSGPKWVGILFTVRNKIVSLFGLKTSGNAGNRQQLLDNFKCEPGERLGLFKVFDKTDNEVVLGEDDTHLNFKISLFLNELKSDQTKKELTITTVVEFNNWFGRIYFLPVRPFHKLIVPAMLKGIIKELEKQNI